MVRGGDVQATAEGRKKRQVGWCARAVGGGSQWVSCRLRPPSGPLRTRGSKMHSNCVAVRICLRTSLPCCSAARSAVQTTAAVIWMTCSSVTLLSACTHRDARLSDRNFSTADFTINRTLPVLDPFAPVNASPIITPSNQPLNERTISGPWLLCVLNFFARYDNVLQLSFAGMSPRCLSCFSICSRCCRCACANNYS